MTNNVGLTFSVGDIILRFTISVEQDKLVTLNYIFSVVIDKPVEFEKLPAEGEDLGISPILLKEFKEYTFIISRKKPKDANM